MTVRHNAAAQRYEMDTGSGLAIAVYREQGDRLIFTHTEVPPEDEARVSRRAWSARRSPMRASAASRSCRPAATSSPTSAVIPNTTTARD